VNCESKDGDGNCRVLQLWDQGRGKVKLWDRGGRGTEKLWEKTVGGRTPGGRKEEVYWFSKERGRKRVEFFNRLRKVERT